MVGIDFLGPFVKSKAGNKYIIAATDHFIRWCECKAIPSATKEEAATFLIDQIVVKHGTPKTLLSDRGVQFRSQFSQLLYERIGTRHVCTTSYHPQCNGMVEKFNHTLA
jgi:transposase InsO family protein